MTIELIKNIYILNLDKNKERWSRISTKLDKEKNNIPYYQFCGIDGSKLNLNNIKDDDIHPVSKKFFLTKDMYGKSKSHINLWKYIVNGGKKSDDSEEKIKKTIEDNEWVLILEDDAIIPDNFNKYIEQLSFFLNEIPKDILDNTDMFNLSPTGDYKNTNKSLHNNILSILTMAMTMILKKQKSSNNKVFNKIIDGKEWMLYDSNFPLCTHAYLVNKKNLENMINTFEKSKIYYHLDYQLNLENLNINTILPIGIKRGGFDDSTTSTKTTPSILVKILTMFNKELACDLGKPVGHIFGILEINVLIIIYGLIILLWNFIDIPGRLNDYFLNIK